MEPKPCLQPDWQPLAYPQAVVNAPLTRFTVLTPRLIRLEFSPDERFEDQPSQLAWYRRLPLPEFSSTALPGRMEIETTKLHLQYTPSPAGFCSSTLAITLKDAGYTWHFGDTDQGNLYGTIRTLDNINGRTGLGPGLLSTEGWTLIDDSSSLVFNENSWLEPRRTDAGTLDLYFFGYGLDFAACLQDYQALAGPCPMVPRQILGNWWSRYHAYSSDELLALLHEFRQKDIPLSVCVIDMDWHLTKTGNTSTGWTGYTWNHNLFPDPQDTLQQLHGLGLLVSLNLHPAEGVHPHEEAYPALARRMGIDPQSGTPIAFDLADPDFAAAYFELLHHPQEKIGVDFWWLDWQQGTASSLPGLDPLWWLNHLHFHDLGRNSIKRPLVFSRWAGHGSHRTPVGFSGDAEVTWQTLAFQPYLTASAANIAYGWWSHDIGGHMGGVEDPELYLRWVQFGVFSPIFRFHSTKGHFHERLPWKYDDETARLCGEILRFRHQLVPYLYTLAWRSHRTGQALVQPMYHMYPDNEEAYACPQQYAFGPDIIAAPFTTPADSETGLSRQVLWLPAGTLDLAQSSEALPAGAVANPQSGEALPGGAEQSVQSVETHPYCEWYNLFTNEVLPCGWHAVYGEKNDIPVFIRAGAVLPLAGTDSLQAGTLPTSLEVRLYAGADGRFDLFEDDGTSTAYRSGCFALTSLSQQVAPDGFRFTIEPAKGETALLPEQRTLRINWIGVSHPDSVSVTRSGTLLDSTWEYDSGSGRLQLAPITLSPNDSLDCYIGYAHKYRLCRPDNRRNLLCKLLKHFKLNTWVKEGIYRHAEEIFTSSSVLQKYYQTVPDSLTETQLQALFECFHGAGLHCCSLTGEEFLILWNRQRRKDFTLLDRSWVPGKPWDDTGSYDRNVVPEFINLSLGSQQDRIHSYTIQFADFFSLSFRNSRES
ncbi:MAG: DUF5110 domain-containing protein [Anaerolineales bacterium]|nr:DUF5110 domain-containing protein [Anaerolineales bacterium]